MSTMLMLIYVENVDVDHVADVGSEMTLKYSYSVPIFR